MKNIIMIVTKGKNSINLGGISLCSESFRYSTKNGNLDVIIEWERWEYEKLNGKLGELLENYFVRIHIVVEE
ncbi:hypothetical protein J2Y03_005789 [Neobacillus niacini]|uniref:hypothetical protein n=1 Tax=Neobacillus niacini TaxID=86668 RepID=UPI002859BACC|nr:hypothetical protein [Neobacillus niacini]MDR7080698.1 hypothetical protein [Neobacillus niacini]